MGHEKLVSMSLGTSESQTAKEINFPRQKLYQDFPHITTLFDFNKM